MTYEINRLLSRLRIAWICLFCLAGCASSLFTQPTPPGSVGESANPGTNLPVAQEAAPAVHESAGNHDNSRVLEKLWAARTTASAREQSSNFQLGPGDVLRISLPQFDSQKDRTVRVSEENTIALPLVGVIDVSGMTEADLRNELARRVANYVYNPQVAVFLERSESRDVAVLGSVKTPGRYMLASRYDTIMTMIARAGGRTEDAASRIILVPAQPHAGPQAAGLVPTRLRIGATQDQQSFVQRTFADQVEIDLAPTRNAHYLQMPARAGDVIIVPAAGDVTVEGWVPNPGKFKITQGMTALSAIAAAGGPEFTSSATVLREQGDGGKLDIPLDLSKVKSGAQSDVPLQGGDVVVVERSVVGAVPFSLYFLVSHLGWGLYPAL
jgi:polysaccharide export outer membrane protein